MLTSLVINVAIPAHTYYTGSLYEPASAFAFLWYALAG